MAKILLVEDDKSLREIYSVRLQAEGYTIVSAGDGEEALAMAIKERPDLIVSDVMMPKISGFDMLDILRSTTETKNVKVIMMTALSSEDQRARGEALGADRYLVKSQVGIEDVVRTVHDVLGDGTASAAPAFPAPSFETPVAQVPITAPVPSLPPTPQPVFAAAATPAPEPVATLPEPFAEPAPMPTAPAPVAAAPAQTMAPAPIETSAYTPPAPAPAPVAPQAFEQIPTPAAPVFEPLPVAPAPVQPSPVFQQSPVAPALAPSPVAAPAPIATPAPAPAPAPVEPVAPPVAAPSTLPQPIAPFSTPAPASLGQRVIEPLPPSPAPLAGAMDLSGQIEQALSGFNTPPTPPRV